MALGRVASALYARGDTESARAIALEAIATAPYGGRSSSLVALFSSLELSDPVVVEAAHARVAKGRADARGAADALWFRLTAGQSFEAPLLERIKSARDTAARQDVHSEARLVLAAGLWMAFTREGDLEAAGEARARLLEAIDGATLQLLPIETRAILRAAEAVRELSVVADAVQQSGTATLALTEAHVRSGAVEELLALSGIGAAQLAHLAAALPDDARADSWFASAEAEEARFDEWLEEGLSTHAEIAAARFALASARARRGARERAESELVAAAQSVTAELRVGSSACREELKRAQEEGASALADPTIVTEEALTKALGICEAAKDPSALFRARKQLAQVLDAATMFAEQGEVERARALIERCLATDPERVPTLIPVRTPLVRAWLATGQLELAVAFARAERLALPAVGAIVAALAARGDRPSALELLGPALAQATTAAELHALAEATLAIAADRRAAAQAMLDAVTGAEAASAALTR
jgi:tetratricopeptide (TPR) repeat protein